MTIIITTITIITTPTAVRTKLIYYQAKLKYNAVELSLAGAVTTVVSIVGGPGLAYFFTEIPELPDNITLICDVDGEVITGLHGWLMNEEFGIRAYAPGTHCEVEIVNPDDSE